MIAHCKVCEGVVKEQAIDAAMMFEQIKYYVNELSLMGVPPVPLEPLREWAKTLRRCSCSDFSFEL